MINNCTPCLLPQAKYIEFVFCFCYSREVGKATDSIIGPLTRSRDITTLQNFCFSMGPLKTKQIQIFLVGCDDIPTVLGGDLI